MRILGIPRIFRRLVRLRLRPRRRRPIANGDGLHFFLNLLVDVASTRRHHLRFRVFPLELASTPN